MIRKILENVFCLLIYTLVGGIIFVTPPLFIGAICISDPIRNLELMEFYIAGLVTISVPSVGHAVVTLIKKLDD